MLSIQDRGLQFGDGLFETIAVYNNTPLCLDEHLSRLRRGCLTLKIPFVEHALIKQEIETVIGERERAVIKLIYTRGCSERGYGFSENIRPNRIISRSSWPDFPTANAETGVRTKICSFKYTHSPELAGIKHLNRLEQILAQSEIPDQSVAEGLVLDVMGNIIEGTMSNLFLVKDGVLITPDLSNCGINGVIREKIIDLAAELKLNFRQRAVPGDFLFAADEIFLCNSIIGLWPVKKIDEQCFSVGDITKQIQIKLTEKNCIAH